MRALRPVTIVGGGLAGLGLGIGLRRSGVPVRVIEAGDYPRHRVCGEFICGRGLELLRDWGLLDQLPGRDTRWADRAAFFLGRGSASSRALPGRALCVSRFLLDRFLAEVVQQLGGEVITRTRWTEDFSGEGVVRATGRRPKPGRSACHWFGIKAHAKGVRLSADLEMHAFPHGYIGLCRLPGDEVDVCGLFRRTGEDRLQRAGTEAHCGRQLTQSLLRGSPGSVLSRRLESASFINETLCAVAGLPLGGFEAAPAHHCCVGDAWAMIPPVTGNGMSMALESARLACSPLAAYSRRELSWAGARESIRDKCSQTFSQRLAWGERLHRAMLSPLVQRFGGPALSVWPAIADFLFHRTR